jgi:GNAT superfamily N-acetyltransferase
MSASIQNVVDCLRTDALKYVVHLKMIEAHADHMTWHVETVAGQLGVLLLLPTRVNAYDARTYPTSEWIVLMAAASPKLADRLVARVPRGRELVFKLVDELSVEAVQRAFPEMQRTTAFVSYTTDRTFDADGSVRISKRWDERLLACYRQNGYTDREMRATFDQGAMTFTLWGEDPLSTCFTFRNYAEIWEIGGVYTSPAHRRQGLASRVVKAAIRTLRQSGKRPRYQVQETNRPSLKLAERLGLERFVTTEHYLHVPE